MRTLNGRLLDLVRELDRLGKEPTLAALGQALQRVSLTPEDVAAYVQPTPGSYNRVPVVVRDAYDLLVLTWLPGQASVPHDHSGSICAVRVVQGEAAEGCYHVAPDGYADLQFEKAVRPGEVLAGQDAGVHTLRNASPTGELLVTVHVYSPPLRDIRQFRQRQEPACRVPRRNPARPPAIVIVGGGFSGAMTAAQTLRRAREAGLAVEVVLVERRGAVGEGVAYSTRESAHLLNVPAGRMSAWPDRPDDFVRWASRRHGEVRPGDFLPRLCYGEYVRESLLRTAEEAGGASTALGAERPQTPGLTVVFDEVRRVARHPSGGWMVHLARQPSLRAEAVVLTVGHRPPSDPIGQRWAGPRTRFIADPWRPFATNVVGPDDPVVILGSGLTAVDTMLSLSQQPRRAPITLLSRNGLLPQAHAGAPIPPVDLTAAVSELVAAPGGVRADALLQRVRREARELKRRGGDWRSVVDGLRPHTATLWQSMPLAERRRFLARLRPFWEVHRHRMAPAVAERLRALLAGGEARLVAGSVVSAQAEDGGVRLVVRQRGGGAVEADASWVINCTGPLPSNSVESNPVIGSLLVSGVLRPDELLLGVETTPGGNAVTADGQEVPDLFLVGTLRKSTDWESTAVPELRQQAAAAAEGVLRWLERNRVCLARAA
jgi:uncharacterized NAD(P)/FAD-binding protein YdhS/predicted metal-dependent enzyme (double-stranded beta helix superfamily)